MAALNGSTCRKGQVATQSFTLLFSSKTPEKQFKFSNKTDLPEVIASATHLQVSTFTVQQCTAIQAACRKRDFPISTEHSKYCTWMYFIMLKYRSSNMNASYWCTVYEDIYIVIYLQTYIEHFTFILDILLSSEVHLPGCKIRGIFPIRSQTAI